MPPLRLTDGLRNAKTTSAFGGRPKSPEVIEICS